MPSNPPPARKAASTARAMKAEAEMLALVRSGVERFILNKATVGDFLKTMRAVAEKEKTYSHQLTRKVFSKIVKEELRKRTVRRPK